jgi:hypothetical protein
MKSLLITSAIAVAVAVSASAESRKEYEVTAGQMNIINITLSKIFPSLGSDKIFSILVTRIDEDGNDLPDQQLISVSESVRMHYAAALVPPPDACLTLFSKAQTWYDSGSFLRNYLCQHEDYHASSYRVLRHDIYWGTTTNYFNNAAEEVECIVSDAKNPKLSTAAFQKLCFQVID